MAYCVKWKLCKKNLLQSFACNAAVFQVLQLKAHQCGGGIVINLLRKTVLTQCFFPHYGGKTAGVDVG